MARNIKNSAGKWVKFNAQILESSLLKAGADHAVTGLIIDAINAAPELRSTEDIYSLTYTYLKLLDRPVAARYSLKQALYQLGPHPQVFIQYLGKIFAEQEYTVREGHTLEGRCVDYEIPLIIEINDTRSVVQCALQERGTQAALSSILTIKALFDDLSAQWAAAEQPHLKADTAMFVTNTGFTKKALEYASCMNIRLLGWDYPEGNNLGTLIHSLGLYPVTCLTGLSKTQKIILVQKNILLCRELITYREVLKKIQVPGEVRKLVHEECKILSQPME